MAVNVSTISSVCLYCKATSDTGAAKFHEICDKVGLEFQLPTLVEKFFHIDVKNFNKKHLCDACVNRLIELYDLEEHAKEESNNVGNFEVRKNIEQKIVIKSSLKSEPWEASDNEGPSLTSPITNNWKQSNSKRMFLKRDNEQTGAENIHNFVYENIENLEYADDKDEALLKNETVFSDLATSISSSPVNVINSNEKDSIDHVEFMVINIADDFDIKETPAENIETNDQNAEEEIFSNEESKGTIQNNIVEEMYLEESLDENKLKSGVNDELEFEDIFIEEIDDTYYEILEISEENQCESGKTTDIGSRNKNATLVKEEIKNVQEPVTVSVYSRKKQKKTDMSDKTKIDQIIASDQDDISNDNYTFEEEYLIEETSCSLEYDNIDLNEYLDKTLVTNFQGLLINWETECNRCLNKYTTLEELLKHECIKEFEEKQQFSCIIKDCNENMNSLSRLARHLVLKHCDKLEGLAIYGKCPDCQKSFSNILDCNKHSCCRNIKRKAGSPNYCQYCDMDFQSLKRYVFHMQFHLTKRRPKVCLLCGDLFNNSNDFFDHTQYQHIPQTALACIKCDRFFKEKYVFESHMELHHDSKYQYSCTVCPKKYTNKISLHQHMDIYHNNKSKALKCDHCAKEFVNKLSYRNHIRSHATDDPVDSFICSTCGIITNNLEIIKYHIESDKQSPCFSSPIEEKALSLGYTCENCSIDFLTVKQLKQHRSSKSHSDDLFHCVICGQVFKSLRHMRNHSINHKNFKEWQASYPITRYFVCNIGDCEEFYPIWTSLYYHKKRPHKTKEKTNSPTEFKCQFCHQLCSSKMSLAVHVARSHNNSNVKCSECKRSFKSQKVLQEHIDRYHTAAECDICFKKFKNRRNLESHNTMVHLNLKRYFCKYCEKGYFHKSERDVHEEKVHPETSYVCEICNFKTTYPKSLEIHMDKHNNQLKFKCTICGRAFGRKQLLQYHFKRHLNKRDYSCAKYVKDVGCEATFLNYNSLKRHIEKQHQNSNYNINMRNEKERKQCQGKHLEVLDDISFEILDSDSGTKSDQSAKTPTAMCINVDSEQDPMEFVSDDDIQFDQP